MIDLSRHYKQTIQSVLFLLALVFAIAERANAQSMWVGDVKYLSPPDTEGYISSASWYSSTGNIVFQRADEAGAIIEIVGYFPGTATVSMNGTELYFSKYTDREMMRPCSITYYITCNPVSIILSEGSFDMKPGETKRLSYSWSPTGHSSKAQIEWQSSNPDVAVAEGSSSSYSNYATITAKKAGSTTITAMTNLGPSMSCFVTVIPVDPDRVSLPSSERTKVGESVKLTPTLSPSDAETTYSWKSDNTSVASVNSTGSRGEVKGIKTGKANITVTTANGKAATCEVTVEKGNLTLSCDTESGLIAKGTRVTLNVNRSDAEIYYTLDGSTPTSSSMRYSSPIAINEKLTLKAIAMGSEYNPSSVVTRTYEVSVLKMVEFIPSGLSFDRNVFPAIKFSETIHKSDEFNSIVLKGTNETPIPGFPIVTENTLYYIPDEPLPLGTYILFCPINAVKGKTQGSNFAVQFQFEIESWSDLKDTEKIKKVDVGRDFSLAVQNNGTMWAWGYNNHGQLGIGNTENVAIPTEILSGIKDIAAGQFFSMAVKTDGTLWTWGENESSQLGNGTTVDSYSPTKIMNNVEMVAAGYWHSLALTTDGTLYAWGSNSYGQLGDKTEEKKLEPVKIMSGVSSISCGTRHSLAIKKDGSLWAWGDNGYGQLGDGTSEDRGCPVKIMDNVVKAVGGSCFTLAIKVDGSLWRWGSNDNNVPKAPQKVMDNVEDVAAKGYGVLIKKRDNTLWQSRYYYNPPVKVLEYVTVFATMNHSLAAKKDGTLWSWGDFEEGQLGYDYQEPKQPEGTSLDFDIIALGSYHALGIKKDGTLWAWGRNEQGQLGDGTNKERSVPVKILNNVSYACAKGNHSLAIKKDGNLYMWGENYSSQLGDGTTTNRNKPVQTLSGVKNASTGREFSVALKTDGSYWEWGRCPKEKYTKPVKVMDGIKKAVAGNYHEVIIKDDNSLWIRKQFRNNFTKILDNVFEVSADGATFAIKDDNSLWSWGDNFYGELGNGTTETQNEPTKVFSNVKKVISNDCHTFIIDKEDNLFACGKNTYGELGNGSKNSLKSFVKVAEGIQSVASGDNCSSAIQNDGKVLFWGSNDYGQFGNGIFSPRYYPRSVSTDIFRESTTTGIVVKNKHVLSVGDIYLLLPELSPNDAFYKKIIFDSSNDMIASVSPRGIITAKQVGTATITVTVDDKFTATCEVTVIDENEIRINSSTHGTVTSSATSAKQGKTITLTIRPDSGYMLESLSVVDVEGKKVECQINGTTAAFVMPASAVTVSASFIEATMPVRTSAAGYATFYDSGWAFTLPTGLQAQVVSGVSDGKLSYRSLTDKVVPKDVPVMLSSGLKRSAEYTLTRTESNATYNGTNLLIGSDETTMTTGDGLHYKLAFGPSTDSKLKDVFGWYWGANGGAPFQIEGHKAWLVVPQSAGARPSGFSIDGDALGIIQQEYSPVGGDSFFDLQGRRIQQPERKGIYINNGKKIVNK